MAATCVDRRSVHYSGEGIVRLCYEREHAIYDDERGKDGKCAAEMSGSCTVGELPIEPSFAVVVDEVRNSVRLGLPCKCSVLQLISPLWAVPADGPVPVALRVDELVPRHWRMLQDAARPVQASIARFEAAGVYLTNSLGTDTGRTALRDLWLRATLLDDLCDRLAWLNGTRQSAGAEVTVQTSRASGPWRFFIEP